MSVERQILQKYLNFDPGSIVSMHIREPMMDIVHGSIWCILMMDIIADLKTGGRDLLTTTRSPFYDIAWRVLNNN